MRPLSRLTRGVRRGAIGALVVVAITLLLWGIGVLSDATQVTAYATTVLAIGTVGLAIGAIGTYIEQRKTNEQQAKEIEQQAKEHENGLVNEMAQVRLERYMSGGFGVVRLRNSSSRAIRNVYVWIEVRGITGRYNLAVKSKDAGAGQDTMFRGMENAPRGIAGGEVYWRMRTILPGDELVFEQIRFMYDNQPIPVTSDSDVTAWAEFEDTSGRWWRCNEDGEVDYAPPTVPVAVQPHPMQGQ